MAYEIRFASSAKRHIQAFPVGKRAVIVAAVETQLSHEPLVETRNRKRLRPNPIAPWELRVRSMRVFYDVDQPGVVTVLAIGAKRGNKLYIEGEEIEL
ncbi:MAG: type II toxin-antitoxin system RelE/ParE family toxin [Acidobacteria bacterium]|nr:type II toxin-antitoxin system RelE/ParE family toxin [Acidobacteriota bacterium]